IKKVHQKVKTTTVYVTHDQVEAMTLADRVVVMNAGTIEQVGAPNDLYHNPATRFVAGFIGSPSMNFMPGKANGGDGRIALDHGGEVLSSNVGAQSGRPITVGIRPEHFIPCGESAGLSGPVEMVEQLGADALVHIGRGDRTIIARMPHGTSPPVGSTFCVTADPARVFAFDGATGARLQ
ncbi:MAG TPA: TOBE domain-containing protein, partial [Casimicrobiaceae bacterium]|nr:TOBE domain-containing protein [Casimicrobiaceae bacterium]